MIPVGDYAILLEQKVSQRQLYHMIWEFQYNSISITCCSSDDKSLVRCCPLSGSPNMAADSTDSLASRTSEKAIKKLCYRQDL